MAVEGTGVKNNARLSSYFTPIADYRTVESAAVDGTIDPADPPSVTLLDNTGSHRGLNDLFVYADTGAGTATLQVWVVLASGKWYLADETTVDANESPCWLVQGLPAVQYAVVVTAATADVELRCSYTQ